MPRIRPVATIAAGAVLGGTSLWLAFRGLDVTELRRAIERLDLAWALAAFASNMASLVLLSCRWQLLFFPEHRVRRFWPLFRAIVIGQMLNIVFPLRVGEVGRICLVARDERVSKSTVLATLAVEKALDLAMFALSVAVTMSVVALPDGVGLRRTAQWVVPAMGLVALWFASRRAEGLERAALRAVRLLPGGVARRLAGMIARFLDGLSGLREPGVALGAVAWSAATILAAALTNYLVMRAFGWTLPPIAALFVLVLIQAGFVPPSLPGKVGIFHYLVVAGLIAFGIDRGPALAYAWALYAIAILPKVVLGALFMLAGGSASVWTRTAPGVVKVQTNEFRGTT